MENFLTIVGLVIFYYCVYRLAKVMYRMFDETNKAKQQAMRQNSESSRVLKMIAEAGTLAKQLRTARTYTDLCHAKDALNFYSDRYRDVPEFENYYTGLLKLLEMARQVVRQADTVTPFEHLRYSPE